MKTLGIMTVYDSQGVIDDYLKYYINSLKEVVNELVIIVNGFINKAGKDILEQYGEIIIRDNIGYDAGGYKEGLEALGRQYILQYDQVIISNDTCFGPFKPFNDIFEKMNSIETDFWGLEFLNNSFLSNFATFFLVFRNNSLNDLYSFFEDLQIEGLNRNDLPRVVELGLFNYLIDKKYSFSKYIDIKDTDIYRAPNYALRNHNFPLMKKRCFDVSIYRKDNCIDALKYIHTNQLFDINMILQVAERKYGIKYDLDKEFKRELDLEEIKVPLINRTWEELLADLSGVKNIFVYGAGTFGKILMERLDKEGKKAEFVVSDENHNAEYIMGKRIHKYSEVEKLDCKIIVAIKDCVEIKKKLKDKKNIIYIW